MPRQVTKKTVSRTVAGKKGTQTLRATTLKSRTAKKPTLTRGQKSLSTAGKKVGKRLGKKF